MTIQNISINYSVVNPAYIAKQALDLLQATSAETYIDDPATRVEYEILPNNRGLLIRVLIELDEDSAYLKKEGYHQQEDFLVYEEIKHLPYIYNEISISRINLEFQDTNYLKEELLTLVNHLSNNTTAYLQATQQENHLYLQVQIEDPYLRAVTYIQQLNQYSKYTHIKATQLDIKEINPYRYQIHIAYQID